MRLKIVLAILLAGALGLGVIVFLKSSRTPPSDTTAKSVTVPTNVVATVSTPPAPPVGTKPILTPEEREAAVQAEIDRLQDWGMNNDPQSLSNILGDLVSPEKEIREAAIEATKQFGSTNAIPVLKAIAANTQDTQEQIELLEAADFLSLPSITAGGIHPATPEQRKAAMQSLPGSRKVRSSASTSNSPSPQP